MAHLAEFNIARLIHALDAPENAEFVAALDPVNALAEVSPGFVWRLVTDDGSSASYVDVPEIDDEKVIVNYSIWEDLESLKHFVTRSGHGAYLRRRKEWFEKSDAAGTVCWWIAEGERPTVAEAVGRLRELQADGPSERGWPLHQPFDPPAGL